MSKRISALLLAVVLVAGSVLNGNTLKVKAASVAVSEDFAVELTMMIYNLLETVAISSGIKDGIDDYESGSSLYDAFIASVESMAEPPYYDTIITMEDGSKMTVKEALDAVESTLGSNALKLPTSETFAKYRVISGTGGNDPEPTPTPSSDPDSTPVPDTGYKDPFSYIQDVLVSSTLLSAMAGIIADLYAGKIDGLEYSDYLSNVENVPERYFKGQYDYNSYGEVLIRGSCYNYFDKLNNGLSFYYEIDTSYPGKICFVDSGTGPSLYAYNADKNALISSHISAKRFIKKYYNRVDYDGADTFSGISSDSSVTSHKAIFYFNIPVFATQAQALAFFQTGELTGLLDGEAYDFPDLATSTAERLQPLTGYEFAPGRLPGINAALSTAAAALPEPGLDPAENTEAYKNALNAALTAALPKPAPEPEPEPDPSPDPGTDGEGESYKRDLRLIFPFCIPFDFIHFIQALSADPVAPCFKIPIKLDSLGIDMVLELDFSWMDPIMEIFRLGELGCFVIMLMAATKKMIGW